VTSSASSRRAFAIAAADGTCPRCGALRTDDQRYCLDCGLALPEVTGRVAVLRRRWIARFGWYPGDWVWTALVTLLLAAAGAAAAIAVTDARSRPRSFVSVPAVVGSSPLPTAPEPTAAGRAKPPPNGRTMWPSNENGWTIVLVSYPKTIGHDAALATAARAAKAGLVEVGVLDSSRYPSLQPGYDVVFTGVYGSKADADAAVATARQAGFGGAYSREIAR
jgi:hypothetical protein